MEKKYIYRILVVAFICLSVSLIAILSGSKDDSGDVRRHVIDSMKIESIKQQNIIRDSAVLEEKKKVIANSAEVTKHINNANYYRSLSVKTKYHSDSLKQAYRKDTTQRSVECDKVIESLETHIEVLTSENTELDSVNIKLQSSVLSYQQIVSDLEFNNAGLNEIIRMQEERLSEKTKPPKKKWFEKPVVWIAGIVTTILIVK